MLRDTAAMVLAAGLGTRLAPYTSNHPKPLLPLLDVPVLELTLRRLVRSGLSRIVVNAFHHGDQVEAFLDRMRESLPQGIELHVSREEILLGTGGGIARARRFFDGLPLLVVNGDVLFELEVGQLLRRHADCGGRATLLLHPGATPDAPRTTRVNPDGRVEAILPRGGGPEACVFTGIYVMEPEVYRMLPERFCSVVEEGLWPALRQSLPVFAEVADFPWFDLGTWSQVMGALRQVLASRDDRFLLLKSLSPGQTTGRGANAGYIGPSARVTAGARLGPGAILSNGCTVGPRACVERSFLLPGSVVDGVLAHAVAGPGWTVGV